MLASRDRDACEEVRWPSSVLVMRRPKGTLVVPQIAGCPRPGSTTCCASFSAASTPFSTSRTGGVSSSTRWSPWQQTCRWTGLLSRIVEIASGLAGAQYAALGVLGVGPERRLRTFVTHGMSPSQVSEIGDLPTGHGLLGLIIDRPEPLRLHDIAEHPASYGFPPSHPPMSSFLGVPLRIRDQVFGNLYLTEKVGGGDFTKQDEEIVVALAAAAGVAIENARLSEQAAHRERWLSATAEITGTLSGASPTGDRDPLQLVADRAREVADADVAWIVAGPDADDLRVRVTSGAAVDRGGDGVAGPVRVVGQRRRPERHPDLGR